MLGVQLEFEPGPAPPLAPTSQCPQQALPHLQAVAELCLNAAPSPAPSFNIKVSHYPGDALKVSKTTQAW